MSNFTKIAPSRMGDIRFPGRKEGEEINSEVRRYTLSPEELEKYRNMDVSASDKKKSNTFSLQVKEEKRMSLDITAAELTKEKYLGLKKEGFSDAKIYQAVGRHVGWLTEKKKEWGLMGVKIDRDGNLITPNPKQSEQKEATTENVEIEESTQEIQEEPIHELETEGGNEVQELPDEQIELLEQIERLHKELRIERELSNHLEQEVQDLKRDKWRLYDQLEHMKKSHRHYVEAMSI